MSGPTCFSPERESAEAYLNNPGFGGTILFTMTLDIDMDTVLDIRNESDAAQLSALVEASGVDMGATTADWLVVQDRVADALVAAGIRWVRLLDTYPVGAETWVYLDPSWDEEDAMVQA
jgi:hypothetical protein